MKFFRLVIRRTLFRLRGMGLWFPALLIWGVTALCFGLLLGRPGAFPWGTTPAHALAEGLIRFVLPIQTGTMALAGVVTIAGERAKRLAEGMVAADRAVTVGRFGLVVGDCSSDMLVFALLGLVALFPHLWAWGVGLGGGDGSGVPVVLWAMGALSVVAMVSLEVAFRFCTTMGWACRLSLGFQAAVAVGVWVWV